MNLRKRVLIVDDNSVIAKTIAEELNQAGYETLEASGGAQAIAVVRQERPDLILLDLNFPPDMNGASSDGYRIMDSLREIKEARTTPIITMTGFPDFLDMERNLDSGAIGFLYKPLDHEALLRLVRGALGTRASVAMAA